MRFKIGQLVWIVSSCNENTIAPPALIISAYEDLPRVILNDPVKNAKWLEYEDVGVGWVYDIMYKGSIEVGVAHEWLRPLTLNKN